MQKVYLMNRFRFWTWATGLMSAAAMLLGQLALAQGPNECPEELFPKYDKAKRLYGYVNLMGEWKIPASYIRAYAFDGKFAPVQLDKKYGVVNCEGYMIVAAQFDAIAPLLYGKAFAKIGDNWTFIDASGKTAYNGYFEDYRDIGERNLRAWVKQKGKWGIFNKEDGRMPYQPTWEAVVPISDSCSIVRSGTRVAIFSQELYQVLHDSLELVEQLNNSNLFGIRKRGRWGIVHAMGHLVQRPQYDSVKSFGGMGYGYLKGKVSLISPRGKVLYRDYDYISPMEEKAAAARKDTAWSLIGQDGVRLAQPHYSYMSTPLKGYAIAKQRGLFGFYYVKEQDFVGPPAYEYLMRWQKGPYYLARKRGVYFFTDPTRPNDALERVKFDSVAQADSLQHVRIWVGGKVHYFSVPEAKLLNAQGFAMAMPMRWGTAFASRDSVWGIWNKAKDPATFTQAYDSLHWLPVRTASNVLLVRTFQHDKKGTVLQGVATLDGQELLPARYEDVQPSAAKQFKVKRNGKWGCVFAGEVTAFGTEWDHISHQGNGLEGQPEWPAIALRKNNYGLIDENGRPVGEQTYRSLTWKGEGVFVAKTKAGLTMLNTRGAPVKSAEPFDSLQTFYQKLAPARKEGKWGFMTFQGRYAVKPIYDEVLHFQGRVALVRQGDKWGSIDRSGNWVSKPIYSSWTTSEGRPKLVE